MKFLTLFKSNPGLEQRIDAMNAADFQEEAVAWLKRCPQSDAGAAEDRDSADLDGGRRRVIRAGTPTR